MRTRRACAALLLVTACCSSASAALNPSILSGFPANLEAPHPCAARLHAGPLLSSHTLASVGTEGRSRLRLAALGSSRREQGAGDAPSWGREPGQGGAAARSRIGLRLGRLRGGSGLGDVSSQLQALMDQLTSAADMVLQPGEGGAPAEAIPRSAPPPPWRPSVPQHPSRDSVHRALQLWLGKGAHACDVWGGAEGEK